jgi:hypothetical protein
MMPFPMSATVARCQRCTEIAGRNGLLSGELALPIHRVARISRLIGNSDSTAKPLLWQEAGQGGILLDM